MVAPFLTWYVRETHAVIIMYDVIVRVCVYVCVVLWCTSRPSIDLGLFSPV